jgi:hypothetical protein
MLYRFSDVEKGILLELVAEFLSKKPVVYLNQKPVPSFVHACRIVSELTEPTVPVSTLAASMAYERGANPMGLSIDDEPDMHAAASREGIDLERELGNFDPRANDPQCIHGVKFKDHCAACSPPPGSAFEFKLGADEQAAIDAALKERQALPPWGKYLQDGPLAVVSENVDLTRVPSVMHRDSCPVSHEHFVVDVTRNQCTCDFGLRLARELGLDH